jgi:orotate phosphoribosyltransferase
MNTTTQDFIVLYGNDPLMLLAAVDGYYEVAKDPNGKRLSPMVGYAGKYPAGHGKELQYVGDVYANFSKAEEHPDIMYHLTENLWRKINIPGPLVFVGPQMGGISIAQFLALHASKRGNARYACAEKVITQLKTDTLREQSEVKFARHSIKSGDRVVIAEDVANNFSTTKQVIELVEGHGAKVVAIACLLNRSMTIDSSYPHNNSYIPVIALVRKPYAEYEQSDPEVMEDIAKGNVILKPKDNWDKLKGA